MLNICSEQSCSSVVFAKNIVNRQHFSWICQYDDNHIMDAPKISGNLKAADFTGQRIHSNTISNAVLVDHVLLIQKMVLMVVWKLCNGSHKLMVGLNIFWFPFIERNQIWLPKLPYKVKPYFKESINCQHRHIQAQCVRKLLLVAVEEAKGVL